MKVSIITIVYNNVDHIEDCINSVLSQSCNNDIEYILIDGGSSDGTIDVINKFKDRISIFLSERDNGLYDALNKGYRMATGDVVGILHSDDMFFNSKVLGRILGEFKETGADVVYGNGVFVDRDNPSKLRRIYSSKPFKERYLKFGWIPLHPGIYIKRDMIHMLGEYDLRYSISSDYDYSIRLFKSGAKKVFINEYIVKMRLGGKSTTFGLQKRKSLEDIEIIRKNKLLGFFTLACKIGRKIIQFVKPYYSNIA